MSFFTIQAFVAVTLLVILQHGSGANAEPCHTGKCGGAPAPIPAQYPSPATVPYPQPAPVAAPPALLPGASENAQTSGDKTAIAGNNNIVKTLLDLMTNINIPISIF